MINNESERAGAAAQLDLAAASSPELAALLPDIQPGESVDAALRRARLEFERRCAEHNSPMRVEFEKERETEREKLRQFSKDLAVWHEEGDIVWHRVLQLLQHRQFTSRSSSDDSESKTLKQIADDEQWMRDAARRYLLKVPELEGFEKLEGYAGAKAIALLRETLAADDEVRGAVGRYWLRHWLYCGAFSGTPKSPHPELGEIFSEEIPAALPAALRTCYPAGSCVQLCNLLESCWRPDWNKIVEHFLRFEPVEPKGFCGAVRVLTQRGAFTEAQEVVRYWLHNEAIKTEPDRRAAVLAAAFFQLRGSLWQEIRTQIEDDKALVDKMIAAASEILYYDQPHKTPNEYSDWPVEPLIGFVKVLDRQCPGDRYENRKARGDSLVTSADTIRELRDQAHAILSGRGHFVKYIEPSPESEPEDFAATQQANHYNRHAAASRRVEVEAVPLLPSEFLKAATRLEARLARTPAELVTAVVECLKEYERALTSEGLYKHIWDIKGTPAPRIEKDVAKELRRWLEQRLKLAVHCEVELYDDSRPDILVQACPAAGRAPVSAVIELKRNCHAALHTAMETQLRDKYLAPNRRDGWTHGIYLVAWMPPPGTRKASASAMQTANLALQKQAKELSTGGLSVTHLILDVRWPKPVGDTSGKKSASAKAAKQKPGKKSAARAAGRVLSGEDRR